MSVLAAPQEQSLFLIWIRDNVLFFSPKSHCLPFQHPYVPVGKEQHTQDAHVSSALCLQQQSHCVCVGGKSVILSLGRGIHFIKGNCVHLFSSYHLQGLASLTEISMNVAIPRVRGMTSYFPNCVTFDIYPQTRTETRPKKSPIL